MEVLDPAQKLRKLSPYDWINWDWPPKEVTEVKYQQMEGFITSQKVWFNSIPLLEILNEKHWTYAECGRQCGLNESTIESMINGHEATLPSIIKLSRALNTPTSAFCEYEITYTPRKGAK